MATTNHCLPVPFAGVASPLIIEIIEIELLLLKNTGLEMRNKKCWVVAMSENSTDVL